MRIIYHSTTAAVDLRRTIRGPDLGSAVVFYRPPNVYPPMRRRIGGTTYIINARCSPTARETAIQKLLRLMLNDPDRKNFNTPDFPLYEPGHARNVLPCGPALFI